MYIFLQNFRSIFTHFSLFCYQKLCGNSAEKWTTEFPQNFCSFFTWLIEYLTTFVIVCLFSIIFLICDKVRIYWNLLWKTNTSIHRLIRMSSIESYKNCNIWNGYRALPIDSWNAFAHYKTIFYVTVPRLVTQVNDKINFMSIFIVHQISSQNSFKLVCFTQKHNQTFKFETRGVWSLVAIFNAMGGAWIFPKFYLP